MQKFVLFYESADDVMSKAPPVYPRHLARLKEFRDRGDLLLVGTFGDPQAEGSMAVFGSREAAEEFVRDDLSGFGSAVEEFRRRLGSGR